MLLGWAPTSTSARAAGLDQLQPHLLRRHRGRCRRCATGRVDPEIGWDLSVAIICRPYLTQNIVFRASGAVLVPGQGFNDLFG